MTNEEKKLVNNTIAECFDIVRKYRDDLPKESWNSRFDLQRVMDELEEKRLSVMYS